MPPNGSRRMSVSPVGPVRDANAPRQTQNSVQSGFLLAPRQAETATAGAPGASGVGQVARVGGPLMLALQEQAAVELGDREARRHGHRLLAALAELQRALLSGGEGSALERLTVLAETGADATDPALACVISSIRLRARLEVARAEAGNSALSGRLSAPGS